VLLRERSLAVEQNENNNFNGKSSLTGAGKSNGTQNIVGKKSVNCRVSWDKIIIRFSIEPFY